MRFLPLSDTDREEIKKFLGIEKVREIFSDIPLEHSYYSLDQLPSSLPENRLIEVLLRVFLIR